MGEGATYKVIERTRLSGGVASCYNVVAIRMDCDDSTNQGVIIFMADSTIVLFDVMGTLVHDPFFWEVPQFLGMGLEQLLAEKHPTAWREFEHGLRTEEEYVVDFFADGRPVDLDGLRKTMTEAYYLLDGMEELLQELHAAGVAMHALSNYSIWYQWIEERLKLSRYLEWTFVSCLSGHRKPAPEIYQHAVQTLGVPASQCLFIDDRESNCEGARAVGMESVLFRGADALRDELRRRTLLP